MKAIPVQQAVGTVLCHDITQIIPGEKKGPLFRRGHIIEQKDITPLLNVGKAHIYVYDLEDGYIHEDDAALRLASAIAGEGVEFDSVPTEGKVTLRAAHDGLVSINAEALLELNLIQDVTIGTIHTHQYTEKGRSIAGTRVIPLAVPTTLIDKAEAIAKEHGPIVSVKPLRAAKVGVVTTGSEVYTGRIKDGFGPILRQKFSQLGSEVLEQVLVSDDLDMTVQAIHYLIDEGADFIALTGGMSVDPDDQTPSAIKASGAEIISYGAPTYPGAMFLLAYLGDTPIVGLPGCVMYHKASIFELIVPRILAGEEVTRRDIVALGHGGLCENCSPCRYPACGFGKM